MKKVLVFFLVVVVGGGVAAQRGYDWYQWQITTPTSTSSSPVVFHVDSSETAEQIGQGLAADGLIRDPEVFRLYLKMSGQGSALEAGDFILNHDMSMEAIVGALEVSHPEQVGVTLQEGLTAQEMASLVEKAGIATATDYLQATKGQYPYDFLPPKLGSTGLEGFLFPDTYLVDKTGGAKQIVQRQLDRFGQLVSPDVRASLAKATDARPAESLTNVIILASMVEREVNRDSDRPLACSVFYNRLANNMLLQVNATILYGEGVWKKQVTYDDLKFNSPYNTYIHPGLPPGPIGNPGLASIQACVDPPKTDYLFYFTDSHGVTHFEKTLADFNRDQQRWGLSGS